MSEHINDVSPASFPRQTIVAFIIGLVVYALCAAVVIHTWHDLSYILFAVFVIYGLPPLSLILVCFQKTRGFGLGLLIGCAAEWIFLLWSWSQTSSH